jgi:type I restriction enzyme S subunit
MTVGDARSSHGSVAHDTREHINALGIQNSAAVLLPPETVCLSRTGSIGYSVRLGREMATSQGFVNWICGEHLLARFLQHLFMAENAFLHRISEGVAHTTIYFPEAKAFHVALPPLPEQRRIVEALEMHLARMDATVTSLHRVRAHLKRYRTAILLAAVEGRLSGGQIGWREDAFRSVVADSLVGLVRNAEQQTSGPPGAPYIKMNNLRIDGSLDLSDLVYVAATRAEEDRFAVRRGDILFNTRNSVELVGKSAVVQCVPSETVFNNNIMRIRVVPGVDPRFLALQMRSKFFASQIARVKRATTSVAAVYAKDLFGLRVRIPSVDVQRRIADEVDHQESVARAIEDLIAASGRRLARVRQSLLRRAFDGHLVPQDPRDEPASVLLDRLRSERTTKSSSPKNNSVRSRR